MEEGNAPTVSIDAMLFETNFTTLDWGIVAAYLADRVGTMTLAAAIGLVTVGAAVAMTILVSLLSPPPTDRSKTEGRSD